MSTVSSLMRVSLPSHRSENITLYCLEVFVATCFIGRTQDGLLHAFVGGWISAKNVIKDKEFHIVTAHFTYLMQRSEKITVPLSFEAVCIDSFNFEIYKRDPCHKPFLFANKQYALQIANIPVAEHPRP